MAFVIGTHVVCMCVREREVEREQLYNFFLPEMVELFCVLISTMYGLPSLSHMLFVFTLKVLSCCPFGLCFPFHCVFQNYISGFFSHKSFKLLYHIFSLKVSGLLLYFRNLFFIPRLYKCVSIHFPNAFYLQ